MKPSRLSLLLLGVLAVLALAIDTLQVVGVIRSTQPVQILLGLLLALLGLMLLDAIRVKRLPAPQVARQLATHLPLGRWADVGLTLHHAFPHALQVSVFDHVPDGLQIEHLPREIELRPGEHTQFSYRVKPLLRGHFTFPRCELLIPSPLRLWQRRQLITSGSETRVYPDFARLYGAHLMAVDDWLRQIGVRQRPRRGLGREFHQLREFRDGDTLRQVDWKATARKRTPIAREYQDEQDQQILFLLDCGRHMRSQDDELPHFDHALNACLLLTYVALRQGDAVGLATCATEQFRYIPPGKGNSQLNQLLNGVYDLESTHLPADFSTAVDQILLKQKRRALVIFITNLRDEHDKEMEHALYRLTRKHQVLIASLREDVLDQIRHTPVQDIEQALTYCGAMEYLQARVQLQEKLDTYNAPVLDVRPRDLGPELVSRYIGWKKGGQL